MSRAEGMEVDEQQGTAQTELSNALEAFKSGVENARNEERGPRVAMLEVWLNKSINEDGDISNLVLLAECCWEEVCEISCAKSHHCAPQVLCLFEKISTVISKALKLENPAGPENSQYKALWHLFMCASGCIRTILASAAEVPQDSSTTVRLISTALDIAHMAFLSPRWLEYVGNEKWIKVLEMYDALTKDIVEEIIIPGATQAVNRKDHIELMIVACKQLTATGLAMADIETKRYSVLKTMWVSICSISNAVPESERARFTTEIQLPRVIFQMVQNFHNKLSEGHTQNEMKSIKVASFWLELVNRLMPGYRTSATHCWTFLAQTCAQLQHWLSPLQPPIKGPLPDILRDKVMNTFASVLVHLLEGMTKKEQQVALSSLQEPFKEGDDSRDGRALTILQLAGKAAEMSPYLKSQLLPNMAWMIKMFGHDFFQEYINNPEVRNQLLSGSLTFFISAGASAATVEGNLCWKACETFLLKLALEGHPAISHFLGSLWRCLLRFCSTDAQKTYMELYYMILSDMAVSCISHQMIDDKSKQFSLLFGSILQGCHPEVQQTMWNVVFQSEAINSIYETAASCLILDSYSGQIVDKGLASEWTILALEAIQKVRGAALGNPEEPIRSVLEMHSFWLLKSIAAVVRIFRMDGCHFQHGDSVAACVCQLLEEWDKLPESILRILVEIIPLCSEELSHTQVSDILPTLGKIIQKYAHMSEAVARLCRQRALTVPASMEIFHFLLHHPHWLVLHHTVEALVRIGRQGDQNNLINLIPPDYRGQEASHPFSMALKAYVHRQHEDPPCIEAVLTRIQDALSSLTKNSVDISAIEASIRKLDLNPDPSHRPSGNDWVHLRTLEKCIRNVAQEGKQFRLDAKQDDNQLAVESLHVWLQEASRLQDLLNKEIMAVSDNAIDLEQ